MHPIHKASALERHAPFKTQIILISYNLVFGELLRFNYIILLYTKCLALSGAGDSTKRWS